MGCVTNGNTCGKCINCHDNDVTRENLIIKKNITDNLKEENMEQKKGDSLMLKNKNSNNNKTEENEEHEKHTKSQIMKRKTFKKSFTIKDDRKQQNISNELSDEHQSNNQSKGMIKQTQIIEFPKIILTISENNNNNEIQTLTITPNSINNKKFDIKKDKPIEFKFGKSKENDWVIPDNLVGDFQFIISYDNTDGRFFVQDHKAGTGFFVKINDNLRVESGMLISFYIDYMYIKILPSEEDLNSKSLKIRFTQGQYKKETTFNSCEKKRVTIGRDKSCDLVYQNEAISKVQCTFIFERGEWIIYDGFYKDNNNYKKSTNGLWMLAISKHEINKGMIFKTGMLLITVNDYLRS